MKKLIIVLSICLGFVTPSLIAQPPLSPGQKLFGIFDGRTPCQEIAAQIHEKTIPECTQIKWRLTLFVDSISGEPRNYELLGFVYKNDNIRKGNWQVIRGIKSDAGAIVYELDQKSGETLFLLKADDNVLFFLNQEKEIYVGDRDRSYTLNRKPTKP